MPAKPDVHDAELQKIVDYVEQTFLYAQMRRHRLANSVQALNLESTTLLQQVAGLRQQQLTARRDTKRALNHLAVMQSIYVAVLLILIVFVGS